MEKDTPYDNPEQAALSQAFPQLESTSKEPEENTGTEQATGPRPVPVNNLELVNSGSRELTPVIGTGLDLGVLSDVPVTLVFEVGTQRISLPQLMELSRGSIIPLPNVYVDSIDVKVSDKTIAKAETINLKQRYGVRLSELVIPTKAELR